jgi:glycosyltransferase involved in cell wall biosynthesis
MPGIKQIRVVQFLNGTVRAGAEEVALELARGLNPARFCSYLVCPQALLDAFGDDWKQASTMAWPLSLDTPWQWPAAREFVKFLRAEKIDVVHAHMTRAALAAVPLARWAGVPVVVQTCHGREAWRTSWLKRHYWVDRRIASWSDVTVAVSEHTAAYLSEIKGIRSGRIRLIRNGRSMNGFQWPNQTTEERLRKDLGILPGDLVVGVFGRLEEQKGHRFLLAALSAVRQKIPTLKVLLVGDGVLRKELEDEVKSKGLDTCVIFTGYRRDCMQLMAVCDLIALPSLYEGMPLVPIEAALLGIPVVATAVDGTKEVIADGVTGVLVPVAQPAALERALVELLPDRARLTALGKQARIRAQRLFSLDRQLRETEALYTTLLDGPASALQELAA